MTMSERVRILELRVIRAAYEDHRGECAPETCGGSRHDPCRLANALEALTFGCDECNRGGHTCPGDGNSIEHGETDCGQHDGCDNCAPLLAAASSTRVDGTDAGRCQDCGERFPSLADDVAELVLDAASEWLKYVQLSGGIPAKMTWHDAHTVRVDVNNGDYAAEFRVAVVVEQLPPPGPENDGALQAELAAAERAADELIWHPRTWADVRSGDTVRLPGTEVTAEIGTAVLLHWNIDPRTGTSGYNPPVAMPHDVMRVRFTHELEAPPRDMDPVKPVEIQLTRSEIDALDTIGWAERTGLMIEQQVK